MRLTIVAIFCHAFIFSVYKLTRVYTALVVQAPLGHATRALFSDVENVLVSDQELSSVMVSFS